MLNEKDRPIVRECDWCGEVKLLHLLEGTHYTICIDCAAMDFILNQRNKESR